MSWRKLSLLAISFLIFVFFISCTAPGFDFPGKESTKPGQGSGNGTAQPGIPKPDGLAPTLDAFLFVVNTCSWNTSINFCKMTATEKDEFLIRARGSDWECHIPDYPNTRRENFSAISRRYPGYILYQTPDLRWSIRIPGPIENVLVPLDQPGLNPFY